MPSNLKASNSSPSPSYNSAFCLLSSVQCSLSTIYYLSGVPMSRIDDLLSQMTLEEKISMLAASDLWFSTPVPRLGIPFFRVADGPNGVRGVWSKMSPASAATPVGIALGATWNPKLAEKIGNVLADEVKAKNGNILLAPTVNIHRTP